MAYNSIFLPQLNCCTGIWSACSVANICSKVETLQHKAIKIGLSIPPYTPSLELYQHFNILKLLEIREIQNSIHMHKLICGLLPYTILQDTM